MRVFILTLLATVAFATSSYAQCNISKNYFGETVASMDDNYPRISARPYNIKGNRYYPMSSSEGFEQNGDASWYGRPFHGRKTANGETYNMFEFTAAHPTLPIPSCVRVTNVENGKSIIVRVNDRGPYKSDLGTDTSNRIIDLSLKAAMALNFRDKGIAKVKLEALPLKTTEVAYNY